MQSRRVEERALRKGPTHGFDPYRLLVSPPVQVPPSEDRGTDFNSHMRGISSSAGGEKDASLPSKQFYRPVWGLTGMTSQNVPYDEPKEPSRGHLE